jgi:hypothetical protein
MSKIKSPESISDLPLALIKNMIVLATSGLGVVVALAWNEAVKGIVSEFIDPYLGKSGGVFSLMIYASIMTILAVLVTMQLSLIEKKLEKINDRVKRR